MPVSALVATDVVRVFGDRTVLDGISLTAAPGSRIGLIGENGSGKSTLLRILAGIDEPDGGAVVRPADLGFAHQELPYPGTATVGDVLDDALAEHRTAVADVDRLARALADDPSVADAYAERLEWAVDHESWDADRRAELALDGLGLAALDRSRPLDTLSGGQRARVGLAALLVRRPAALLLDEPTNHLDDGAAAFLEERLRALPGVVVVASHDRAFLDAVCTDVVDLDPGVDGPARYGGGYSDYQESRRAARARWEQRYAAEQEELKELRHSVAVTARRVAPHARPPRDNERMMYGLRGMQVENQVGRRVRNAQRRLDELSEHQVRRPPQPLRFRATLGSAATGPAAALRDVHVPQRLFIDTLDIGATDRLLITGPNGSGKSTLLAVLAGRLGADGTVHRRRGLTLGLLTQDVELPGLPVADERHSRPEGPDERAVRSESTPTPRSVYTAAAGEDAVPLRELGLLHPRDLDRPVGVLSVGQQRRLELAVLVASAPQLLLLDEPTNHLSPALADELEEALGTGPGAVVVASHDRWLRRRWTGREIRLDAGRPTG